MTVYSTSTLFTFFYTTINSGSTLKLKLNLYLDEQSTIDCASSTSIDWGPQIQNGSLSTLKSIKHVFFIYARH